MTSDDSAQTYRHADFKTGISLLFLIFRSQTWVHRRVDSLRLDLEGATRRHVSVDLTLPEQHQIPGSKDRIVVPVAILEKGVVRKLDASHGGKPVSVLGRADNGRLAIVMVGTAVTELLQLSFEESEVLDDLLRDVIEADVASEAYAAVLSYRRWVDQKKQPEKRDQQSVLRITHQVVRQLARNFILFVELDSSIAGTRTTVKYAHNQEPPDIQRRGLKQVLFDYKVPDYGFAASHHVEIEVPPGLMVSSMKFDERKVRQRGTARTNVDPSSFQRLGHVALSPSSRFLRGQVEIEVVPAEQGLLLFTNVAVLGITTMFLAAQLVRLFDDAVLGVKAEIPSPSASILLIGPALLFSWMSRSPEHNLVVELLSPLRKILFMCALVLLGTAVLAAIPVTATFWSSAWFIIGVLVAGSLVALTRYNQADLAAWFRRKWEFVSAWAAVGNNCRRLAVQCRSIRRHG